MSFDQYAKEWDQPHRLERGKIIASEIKKNLRHPNGKAMEFGAGTGIISLNLSDYFESIIAIDDSKLMIDQLAEKIAVHPELKIYPVKADIYNEDIEEKFDVIFHSMVLHHINDIQQIHNRFNELLNPGGQLIFVDLHSDDGSFHASYPEFDGHHGFDVNELCNLVNNAGFEVDAHTTFLKGKKIHEGVSTPYSLFIMSATKK